MYLACRRFLPLSSNYLLFLCVFGVLFFSCFSVSVQLCNLISDLNFSRNVSIAIRDLRAVIRLTFIGLCDVIVHTEQTDMYEA